jgi:hypothetical protein
MGDMWWGSILLERNKNPIEWKTVVATSLQLHFGEGKWAALLMPNLLMVLLISCLMRYWGHLTMFKNFFCLTNFILKKPWKVTRCLTLKSLGKVVVPLHPHILIQGTYSFKIWHAWLVANIEYWPTHVMRVSCL